MLPVPNRDQTEAHAPKRPRSVAAAQSATDLIHSTTTQIQWRCFTKNVPHLHAQRERVQCGDTVQIWQLTQSTRHYELTFICKTPIWKGDDKRGWKKKSRFTVEERDAGKGKENEGGGGGVNTPTTTKKKKEKGEWGVEKLEWPVKVLYWLIFWNTKHLKTFLSFYQEGHYYKILSCYNLQGRKFQNVWMFNKMDRPSERHRRWDGPKKASSCPTTVWTRISTLKTST